METKTISIDITADLSQTEYNENAGVMWEHNATQLVFNLDDCYLGDYRYYIEYRSLLGTKVRTDYLELDGNTITYPIPVSMTSLKSVECYFNIISIDEDGNTTQVIKPRKFCLDFDFSPDTDNSLAKVNDFSINSLLEAIRLGTFKGDKGDTGEKGDKGDKGDTGERGNDGEITISYADKNYSNALVGNLEGGAIVKAVDALENDETVEVQLSDYEDCTSIKFCGKNLFDMDNCNGFVSPYGGLSNEIVDDKITISCSVASRIGQLILGTFPAGTYYISADSDFTATLWLGDTDTTLVSTRLDLPLKYTLTKPQILSIGKVFSSNDAPLTISKIQVEYGDEKTEYEPCDITTAVPDSEGKVLGVRVPSHNMTILADGSNTKIQCRYKKDINKVIEKMSQAIIGLGGNL